MPQDIRIWEITDKDKLKEISDSKLDSEERLENWLEEDISMISDELMVIGRQARTDSEKFIDLLCISPNGDLTIVELKKDKTPRDVTAQALEYAAWVKDLSHDRVTEIARSYFKKRGGGSFDEAFGKKFGTDLPEILNVDHKMLIVASEIDSSTERIIKYLSDTHAVPINWVTFEHFKENGKEFLSRVFLIDPNEAQQIAETKSLSKGKRKHPLSYEELEEIARKNGAENLYRKIFEELSYFDQKTTNLTSLVFIGFMGEDNSHKTIFSIKPEESTSEMGIQYEVYVDRFADYFGVDKKSAMDILSSYRKEKDTGDAGERGRGYFKDEQEIDKFLGKLREMKSDAHKN